MLLIILIFCIFVWINYNALIMLWCKYNVLSLNINLWCYIISITWSIIVLYFDLYIVNTIIYLIFLCILKKRD